MSRQALFSSAVALFSEDRARHAQGGFTTSLFRSRVLQSIRPGGLPVTATKLYYANAQRGSVGFVDMYRFDAPAAGLHRLRKAVASAKRQLQYAGHDSLDSTSRSVGKVVSQCDGYRRRSSGSIVETINRASWDMRDTFAVRITWNDISGSTPHSRTFLLVRLGLRPAWMQIADYLTMSQDVGFRLSNPYEDGPCLVVCKPPGLPTQAPPGIDSLEVRIKAFLKASRQPAARRVSGRAASARSAGLRGDRLRHCAAAPRRSWPSSSRIASVKKALLGVGRRATRSAGRHVAGFRAQGVWQTAGRSRARPIIPRPGWPCSTIGPSHRPTAALAGNRIGDRPHASDPHPSGLAGAARAGRFSIRLENSLWSAV